MVTTVNSNSVQAINTSLFSLQKEIDALQRKLDELKRIELVAKPVEGDYVPITRTINGKPLDKNISLTSQDVGALPIDTHIPADQVNSDWNAESGVAKILHKPDLSVYATNQALVNETTRASAAENSNLTKIEAIESLIPEGASEENKLTDKDFVNSSISTNTAYFKGTFDSLAEIEALTDVTNNDYAFLRTTDTAGNTIYKRYKYNSENRTWIFEYDLNNSSFTAEQWAAINSGITNTTLNGYVPNTRTINGKALSNNVTLSGNTSINKSGSITASATKGNVSSSATVTQPTITVSRSTNVGVSSTASGGDVSISNTVTQPVFSASASGTAVTLNRKTNVGVSSSASGTAVSISNTVTQPTITNTVTQPAFSASASGTAVTLNRSTNVAVSSTASGGAVSISNTVTQPVFIASASNSSYTLTHLVNNGKLTLSGRLMQPNITLSQTTNAAVSSTATVTQPTISNSITQPVYEVESVTQPTISVSRTTDAAVSSTASNAAVSSTATVTQPTITNTVTQPVYEVKSVTQPTITVSRTTDAAVSSSATVTQPTISNSITQPVFTATAENGAVSITNTITQPTITVTDGTTLSATTTIS